MRAAFDRAQKLCDCESARDNPTRGFPPLPTGRLASLKNATRPLTRQRNGWRANQWRSAAKLLKDDARRIAVNIAKLPELLAERKREPVPISAIGGTADIV
jgi:hypothetical protein